MSTIYEQSAESARFIRAWIGEFPRVTVVLGSGLGGLADRVERPVVMACRELPHWPKPTVEGHAGNLIVGTLGGTRVSFLQGRLHYYEGHDLEAATFPIRVLQRLGVRTLILTSAAGGIAPDLRTGDLVVVSDHLNLLGGNPLRGPHDPRFGDRFPDMSEVYSSRLRTLACEAAASAGQVLKTGVYAAMSGPSYETPAEIRMLRTLGADVVGMSTVPEAIVARQSGMEVLAFSVVTNPAAGLGAVPLDHHDVLEAGEAAGGNLAEVLLRVIPAVVATPATSAIRTDLNRANLTERPAQVEPSEPAEPTG
jgi:purine-nucleoside phosphorylase